LTHFYLLFDKNYLHTNNEEFKSVARVDFPGNAKLLQALAFT